MSEITHGTPGRVYAWHMRRLAYMVAASGLHLSMPGDIPPDPRDAFLLARGESLRKRQRDARKACTKRECARITAKHLTTLRHVLEGGEACFLCDGSGFYRDAPPESFYGEGAPDFVQCQACKGTGVLSRNAIPERFEP